MNKKLALLILLSFSFFNFSFSFAQPTYASTSGWSTCRNWDQAGYSPAACRQKASTTVPRWNSQVPTPPAIDASDDEWYTWTQAYPVNLLLSSGTKCGLAPSKCLTTTTPTPTPTSQPTTTPTPTSSPEPTASPQPTATPTVQPTPTVDVLNNSSFEQPADSEQTAYDWQNFGTGYERTNAKARTGSWSIKLTSTSTSTYAGAYQRIDFNQTSLKPVFVGGYLSGQSVNKTSTGFVGASLYAEIIMNDGSIAYWNSIANSGTFDWQWVGFNTGTLASVNKPISHIFLVPILANSTGTAYFDDLRIEQHEPSQSAVTIMFDDGEDSTYTAGKPILDKYGFKANAAIITGEIGNNGYMTAAQLQNLQSSGWEITSHSVTHPDMTTLSTNSAQSEFNNSKITLQSLGLNITNFAFPFGAYNGNLIRQGSNSYRSLRLFEQGDNPQGSFPYDVKVHGVINTTTTADINNWIQQANNNKRWSVIVFHKITTSGDDAYYTTPTQLDNFMSAISSNGIQVITYNQGLDKFAVSQ